MESRQCPASHRCAYLNGLIGSPLPTSCYWLLERHAPVELSRSRYNRCGIPLGISSVHPSPSFTDCFNRKNEFSDDRALEFIIPNIKIFRCWNHAYESAIFYCIVYTNCPQQITTSMSPTVERSFVSLLGGMRNGCFQSLEGSPGQMPKTAMLIRFCLLQLDKQWKWLQNTRMLGLSNQATFWFQTETAQLLGLFMRLLHLSWQHLDIYGKVYRHCSLNQLLSARGLRCCSPFLPSFSIWFRLTTLLSFDRSHPLLFDGQPANWSEGFQECTLQTGSRFISSPTAFCRLLYLHISEWISI